MGWNVFAAGLAIAALTAGCGARGDLDDGSSLDPSIVSSVPTNASDAEASHPADASSERGPSAGVYQGRLPPGLKPDSPDAGASHDAESPEAGSQDAGNQSPPPLPYSLVLYGEGFKSYELGMIGAAVVRMPDMVIVDTGWRMIAGGTFFLPFPSVLQKGSTYRIAYFVDREEDGLCQPTHDPAWRVELPPAEGDVDLQVNASDQTFAGACAAF